MTRPNKISRDQFTIRPYLHQQIRAFSNKLVFAAPRFSDFVRIFKKNDFLKGALPPWPLYLGELTFYKGALSQPIHFIFRPTLTMLSTALFSMPLHLQQAFRTTLTVRPCHRWRKRCSPWVRLPPSSRDRALCALGNLTQREHSFIICDKAR